MSGRVAVSKAQPVPAIGKAASARAGRSQARKSSRMTTSAVLTDKPPMLGEFMRPDAAGRFGKFGGKYVPETLIPALQQLEAAYKEAMADPAYLVRVLRPPSSRIR